MGNLNYAIVTTGTSDNSMGKFGPGMAFWIMARSLYPLNGHWRKEQELG